MDYDGASRCNRVIWPDRSGSNPEPRPAPAPKRRPVSPAAPFAFRAA